MFVCATWRPAAWHLHVELHGVHAQDGVSHVAEQVPGRHHPGERWKLGQLLKLLLPPGTVHQLVPFKHLKDVGWFILYLHSLLFIREVDVGAELQVLELTFPPPHRTESPENEEVSARAE